MKYLIVISISFLFNSCSSNNEHQGNLYLNEIAGVEIGNIPFNLSSAKLVSSVIKPVDRQTILILSENTLQDQNVERNEELKIKPKWLIIYWEQMDDPVWIGARIPGKYLFTDLVQFDEKGFTFNRYDDAGRLLKLNNSERETTSEFILSIGQI